jgi:hypothetical protein
MANRIQLRRDSQSNWESINPILADGEPGLNYDNNKIKVGNGSDNWTSLSYATGIPTLSYNDLSDQPFIPASITDLISSGGSNARQFLRYNGGTGQIEFSSDFRVVPFSDVDFPNGTIGIDKVGDVAFSAGAIYYCVQEPNSYPLTWVDPSGWAAGIIQLSNRGPNNEVLSLGSKLTDGNQVVTVTELITGGWDGSRQVVRLSTEISAWRSGTGTLTVITSGNTPNTHIWARIGSEVAIAPAHNTSNGIAGQIAYDANYIYRCVQSNLPQITAGVYATAASVSGNNQSQGSNTVNVLDANGVVAPQNGWTVSDGSNQRTITNVNRQNSAWGYIYTLTLNNTIDWSAPTSLTILSQLSQSGVWKRTALNADTW